MRKTIFALFSLIALTYIGLCIAVFAVQRSLIYMPQPRALPMSVDAEWIEVEGVRVQLSVRRPAGQGDVPALIYFGGNAEDVSLSVEPLARAFPGHALYLLHYRGYGGSEGTPSEAALFADALALHAHVAAAHSRIRVLGRSLGSGVAVYLASQREVEQLVLITPYDSIAAVAAQQFPHLPVDWLLLDRFDSVTRAAAVRAPTRILVAERDEVIHPQHSHRLQRAFKPGIAELQVLAGSGHNSISQHPDYWRLLAAVPVPVR
jgi:pimeloyl-ACP methyl ester carboxylesterase